MDGRLILGKKEIPASHIYDYADSNGFPPMLKMRILGNGLALNSQRYFDFFPTGRTGKKLKGFAYPEGKVGRLWLSFPRFLPMVFTISSFSEA
jgi:hypothetical protein